MSQQTVCEEGDSVFSGHFVANSVILIGVSGRKVMNQPVQIEQHLMN